MICCDPLFNPLPKARLEAVVCNLPINLQVLGIHFALDNIVAMDVSYCDRLAIGNGLKKLAI